MLGHEPSVAHTLKSIVNFAIFSIALAVGTVLLVQFSRGYRYDLSTGQVQEFGRLIVTAPINGAFLSINDGQIVSTTPYEENVGVGRYKVQIEDERFRPWRTELFVPVGTVRIIDDILLVPTQLRFTAQERVVDASFSPDESHYMTLRSAQLNISSITEPDPIAQLPVSAQASTIRDIIWSQDGQRAVAVIADADDDVVEAIQIDLSERAVVGRYSVAQANQLDHLFNDGSLALKQSSSQLRIIAADGEVRTSLRGSAFMYTGNHVVFKSQAANQYAAHSTTDNLTESLSLLRGAGDSQLVGAFDSAASLRLVYQSAGVTRLVLTANQQPVELTLPANTTRALASESGRRILLQKTDQSYWSFDPTSRDLIALDIPAEATAVEWLDDYRVQYFNSESGQYVLHHHNNLNVYDVGTAPVFVNSERTQLYRVIDAANGATIEQALLLE